MGRTMLSSFTPVVPEKLEIVHKKATRVYFDTIRAFVNNGMKSIKDYTFSHPLLIAITVVSIIYIFSIIYAVSKAESNRLQIKANIIEAETQLRQANITLNKCRSVYFMYLLLSKKPGNSNKLKSPVWDYFNKEVAARVEYISQLNECIAANKAALSTFL